MLALRTAEGIPETYLRGHCDSHELEKAIASGNLIHSGNGMICIPEDRFFVSDAIITDLV